jgi:hypothetical protein
MTTEMLFRPSRTITKITANLSNLGDVDGTLQSLNLTSDDIPTTFNKWSDENRLSVVKDQQNCGSCWSMSSTSVLSDRFIIAKNLETLNLNPLIALSCSTGINKGCDGGIPSECGKFFETHGTGVESDTCIGWNKYCGENKCMDPPDCRKLQCDYVYKAVKDSTRSLAVTESNGNINADLTILSIKADVMKYGPVVACLFMPYSLYDPDFWPETNGVFINGKKFYNERLVAKFAGQKVMGAIVTDWDKLISLDGQPAGHAMSIVGWGVQRVDKLNRDVPYWVVRNSWGTKWADNGYFKYAIYDEANGINTTLGLDVPLIVNRELFGSCTTFLANTQSGSVNDVARQQNTRDNGNASDNGNGNIEVSPTTVIPKKYDKNFAIKYVLYPLLGVICLLVITYILYKNKTRISKYISVVGQKISSYFEHTNVSGRDTNTADKALKIPLPPLGGGGNSDTTTKPPTGVSIVNLADTKKQIENLAKTTETLAQQALTKSQDDVKEQTSRLQRTLNAQRLAMAKAIAAKTLADDMARVTQQNNLSV